MTDTLQNQLKKLLQRFSGQQATLVIPRAYIDLCEGDHLAALLLNQIVYWSDRATLPDGWFAKSYDGWHQELVMSQYQVSRAMKALKLIGVETEVRRSPFHQFAPVVHYRVNWDVLSLSIIKFLDNADYEVSSLSDYQETSQSLYSEITPESTSENTPQPPAGFNIFELYHDAFGQLVAGAMLADELKDASAAYAEDWLRDAFKIAADNNVPRWSYVRGILERWKREGRDAKRSDAGEVPMDTFEGAMKFLGITS